MSQFLLNKKVRNQYCIGMAFMIFALRNKKLWVKISFTENNNYFNFFSKHWTQDGIWRNWNTRQPVTYFEWAPTRLVCNVYCIVKKKRE